MINKKIRIRTRTRTRKEEMKMKTRLKMLEVISIWVKCPSSRLLLANKDVYLL